MKNEHIDFNELVNEYRIKNLETLSIYVQDIFKVKQLNSGSFPQKRQ
jgi:hypothetical protein